MKLLSRSSLRGLKMPSTQVFSFLDENLVIVTRAWGSQDFTQKFIDEISYFLSSAQADVDVTSPFEKLESLTDLANKTRISLLMVHDHFFRTQNKNDFNVGFEAAVLFQIGHELAWSSVGRFALKQVRQVSDGSSFLQTLFETGTDRDSETLLPPELLGVEKDVEIQSGAMATINHPQIFLVSTFDGELAIDASAVSSQSEFYLSPSNNRMSYWYSLIKID